MFSLLLLAAKACTRLADAGMVLGIAATGEPAEAPRRTLQNRYGDGRNPVSFDHNVADRGTLAAESFRLQLERADRLPQQGAALADWRELRRVEIKPGLRNGRSRHGIDLDIANVAAGPESHDNTPDHHDGRQQSDGVRFCERHGTMPRGA